jgi:ubiquitin-protein ligase
MVDPERDQRLREELDAMTQLAEQSEVLDFEATDDPPTKYMVTFRGKALKRDVSARAEVEVHELHKCEIRIPYSFPDRPPDIRWLTPIFHPNVSFSGLIRLADIGMAWDKDLSCDVLCERLWDMARFAYMDLDKAANYSAKTWAEDPEGFRLPLDARPLRGGAPRTVSNVVRYRRRGAGGVTWSAGESTEEVLYIGEDTPVPPMPRRSEPDDDDVLYIGDDD